MIFFYYGTDTYRIHEAAQGLLRRFLAEGAEVERIPGIAMSRDLWITATAAVSLFSSKKLLIITDFLLENKDQELKREIAEQLKKPLDSPDVAFIEQGMPDKRSTLFKLLSAQKDKTLFEPLAGLALSRWIEAKIKSNNCIISPAATSKLVMFAGSDLWRLSNEIEKLCLFCQSEKRKEITPLDIEHIVQAEDSATVFEFIDALAQKNAKKALICMYRLLKAGESEHYILSMIVYQYRNILAVHDLLSKRVPPDKIAAQVGIHPYVAQKTTALAHRYTLESLKTIYLVLEESEYLLKSGQRDPGLTLDLLVAQICEK